MAQGQLQQIPCLFHNNYAFYALTSKKQTILHGYFNISGRQNSTLKSAEIVILGHSESVDYQHSFFCKTLSYSTGKERDEETGYGYFGARYMDHELMTMWLSVDPMADKYPNISPYAYCAWNPVKLVDPDGRKIKAHDDLSKEHINSYLKELFGTSKMFSFSRDNYLKINNKRFQKYYSLASSDQRILLDGLKSAIEKGDVTALVRITDNNKGITRFVMNEFIGLNSDGSSKYNTSYHTMNTNGESGFTSSTPMEGTIGIVYPIVINDKGVDQQNSLTTDLYILGGSESDVLYPFFTTTTASSVFIHEVLDEFLNRTVEGKVTQKSSGKEKVAYQNAALRILGRYERNGEDHNY